MGEKTGPKRKIPQGKWDDVYKMYEDGYAIPQIHKVITDEWMIECSERTLYQLLKELRIVRAEYLNDLLNANAEDIVGRYKWIQSELENLAVQLKSTDKELFLKVADRLIKIYEFQMPRDTAKSKSQPNNDSEIETDHGRQELINELQNQLSVATYQTKESKEPDKSN